MSLHSPDFFIQIEREIERAENSPYYTVLKTEFSTYNKDTLLRLAEIIEVIGEKDAGVIDENIVERVAVWFSISNDWRIPYALYVRSD